MGKVLQNVGLGGGKCYEMWWEGRWACELPQTCKEEGGKGVLYSSIMFQCLKEMVSWRLGQ